MTDTGPTMSDVDRLTRWASTALSRRGALKGAFGAASALIGVGWLAPIVAVADNCNHCNAQCSGCYSATGPCESPSGTFGWCCMSCSCPGGCPSAAPSVAPSLGGCDCFFAYTVVCDSGSYSYGCSPWCWC